MRFNVQHLPPQTAGRLREYHRWRQLRRYGRVLFAGLAVYCVMVLLVAHVDRFVFLSDSARWGLLIGVHGLVFALVAGAVALVILRRPTTRQVAYELESRLGAAVQERLVTLDAVLAARAAGTPEQVMAGGATDQLIGQLRASTEQLSQAVTARRLAQDRLFRWLANTALAILLVIVLLAVWRDYQLPLMLQRFYMPAGDLPRASFVEVQALPGDAVVGHGGEVVIQARVTDNTPSGIRWLMRLLGATPQGARVLAYQAAPAEARAVDVTRVEPMARVQRDLFLFTRSDLDETFSYEIRTANTASPRYEVKVVAQPRIVDLSMHVTPPDYAGLPPRTETKFDQPLRLLRGAAVAIDFSVDQAINRAWLRIEGQDEPVAVDWDDQARRGRYTFAPTGSVELEVRAENEFGFENVERQVIRLTVQEDLPPRIMLNYPPAEVTAVASEIVPIDARVEDDLGVAEVQITYLVNPDPETEQPRKSIPLKFPEDQPIPQEILTELDLAMTNAGPGDTVSVQVVARDAAGNEGTSREVLIRVVPFTRGAHEQRRLVALRFVSEALGKLAADDGGAVDGQPTDGGIDVATWDAITAAANRDNIPLPDYPNVQSLLQLLEMEQYLTDRADDQRDLRHLSGLVRFAAEPAMMPDPQAAAEYRRQTFEQLSGGLIHRLVGYRQSRNLIWRLYGMRSEAIRLDAELAKIAASDEQMPSMVSLNSRSRIYLKALEKLGGDLQALAATTDKLDEEAIKESFTTINTAGYFLARGGLARRRESAEQVTAELNKLIDAAVRPLPELLTEHLKARAELHRLYDQTVTRVAAAAADPQAQAAGDWLAMDETMMQRNATSCMTDRVLRIRLRDAIASGDGSRRAAAAEALITSVRQPPAELVAARALSDATARAWRLARLQQIDQLSDEERALETVLIALEHRVADAPDRAARVFAELRKQTAGMQTLPEALARTRPTARAVADWVGQDAIPLPDRLMALQEKLEATGEAVVKLNQTIDAGDEPQIQPAAAALAAALAQELSASDLMLNAVRARLNRLPGASAAARTDALDGLTLRWRAAHDRFRLRAQAALDVLRNLAAGDSTAEARGLWQAEGQRLVFLHNTLAGQLTELTALLESGEMNTERQAVSGVLRLTHRMASTLLDQQLDEAGRRTAAAVLADVPGAALTWAKAFVPQIDQADAALVAALDAVSQAQADARVAGRHLTQARAALDAVTTGMRIVADDSSVTAVVGRVASLAGRIEQLQGEPLDSPEAINRARFLLKDMTRESASLIAEFDRPPPVEAAMVFRGGPRVGQWAKPYDQDVRHTQARLASLAEHCRRQSLLAALEPLRAQGDAATPQRGYAWAALVHRMVRGDLYQTGGVRSGGAGTKPKVDEFIKYLEAQLSQAKQLGELKLYTIPAKRYLELVGDYLKY